MKENIIGAVRPSLLVRLAVANETFVAVCALPGRLSNTGRRAPIPATRRPIGGIPGRVMVLIVKPGLVPVASGLILRAAATLVVMRVLTNRPFGVVAHDPPALSGTALVVLGISAFATWLPARRATRIDPAMVLRSE